MSMSIKGGVSTLLTVRITPYSLLTQKARCRALVFNQKKCPSVETLEHIVYIGKIQLL